MNNEFTMNLDDVFGALADPTRRDILQRVSQVELSVSDIASVYDMTLAAISKHLKILEKARLVVKQRRGKQQFVQVAPMAFKDAAEYLNFYEQQWSQRLDALENYLREES
jgi:DNA-binding transcriptional ArsR family regulator